MTEATLRIPIDIWRFSQNALTARMAWRAKAGLVKAARQAGYVAWLRAGRPNIGRDAIVGVLVRRFRRFDTANVYGALKPIIDGVFTDGMMENDSQVRIGEVVWETGKQWSRREEVVMTFSWVPQTVALTGKDDVT